MESKVITVIKEFTYSVLNKLIYRCLDVFVTLQYIKINAIDRFNSDR